MKYLFIAITILFLGMQISAQNDNRISIFYGFAGNELIRNTNLDGAPSYDGKGSTILGVTYQRTITHSLSLETGLEYSKNKIEITPAFYPELYKNLSKNIVTSKAEIYLITIPVYVSYTFLKYFYAKAGVLIDFETNRVEYPKTDDQSGVGFGAGIGGQHTYQNFTIFVNPMIQYHAVIPKKKENHQQHLTETGIKFGVAYNF